MEQRDGIYAFPRPLNADEAAKRLGVSAQRVREMARSGRIPAKKVGHVWRFDPQVVDELARRRGGDV